MTQQQQPGIGIVIGSTREGRFGEKPAHWINEIAKQRTDLAFEVIDLHDFPLPFFTSRGRRPTGRSITRRHASGPASSRHSTA